MAAIIPLPSLRRLHRSPLRRQSARRRSSTAAACPTDDDAGDRQRDELLRDDVRAAAGAGRHRRADAHLHAGRRAADGRASDHRQHVRARARGRDRAAAASSSCSGSASDRCRCVDLARRRSELRVDDAAEPDLRRADRRSRAAPRRRLSLSPAAVSGPACPCRSCRAACRFCSCRWRRARPSTRRAAAPACSTPLLQSREGAGAHGVFIFSPEPGDGDRATVYSRMFAPDLGVIARIRRPAARAGRSAATSSGTGRARPRRRARCSACRGEDGPAEPRAHLDRRRSAATISSVRVGGESVLAGEGLLYV